MADETKKYIIDIESNLKEYADEALKAKIEVDKLTAANAELKKSGKEGTAEYEANKAALKNANDEYRKAQTLLKTQIAYNQSETGSRKQLSEQLKLQEQALGKLGNAYITNAKGQKELNPLYITQRNEIAKTKQAIVDYDLALNDGRSNIGRYGEAVKGAFVSASASFKDAAINLLSFSTVAALAAKAIQGIKEAFFSTDEGIGVLKKWTAGAKAFFKGVISSHEEGTVAAAAEIAGELENLRILERTEKVKIQRAETDVKLLRLKAATTKDLNKQEEMYLEASRLEDEAIKLKTDHLEQEIFWMTRLWTITKDSALADEVASKRAELIAIEGEKNIRVQTKIATTREKILKDKESKEKKAFDDEQERIKETQKALQKEIDDYDKAAREKFDKEVEFQRIIFEQNRKDGQAEYDARIAQEQALADAVIQIHETMNNAKMRIASRAADFLNTIAGDNKGLQNASLIADKALAIAEVIIQTTKANATIRAMAAASVLPGPGYLARLAASMAAAMAPINLNRAAAAVDIATIVAAAAMQLKSNSQSSNSSVSSAPTAIAASIPAQRTFAQSAGSSILNQPQLSQTQLNAIPNQNLLTADAIAMALSKLPPPIVTVEDINVRSSEVRKIAVRARI